MCYRHEMTCDVEPAEAAQDHPCRICGQSFPDRVTRNTHQLKCNGTIELNSRCIGIVDGTWIPTNNELVMKGAVLANQPNSPTTTTLEMPLMWMETPQHRPAPQEKTGCPRPPH